ncbi:hypothetical protein AAHA92_21281 [Salvia divinorum]|uniref:Uncharacterized protein n=1 Tax=Salvia divinorum TaxID=28513 RepID=A0ABD1GJX8_SALDI
MAHSHRLKKFSAMQSQILNRITFHVAGGVSDDSLSKLNDHAEPMSSVTMGSTMLTTGNGMSPGKIGHPQSKGPFHGRTGMSMAGKKQSRTTGAASSPRR